MEKKDSSRPLISVVVLTSRGRKREIFRCLTSIENSHYGNMEVILVENGCNHILTRSIMHKFSGVNIIQLPANTGCFGFNVGYANAKGKYILSLDDDTTIKSDTIEKIIEALKKTKNKVILSLSAYNPKNKHFYLSSSGYIGFQAGAVVLKKDLFDKVGYYDENFFLWGEEDDFALRALEAGYKIDAEKSIVINHYEKQNQLRKTKIFLNARNKAWLNIKHFSLRFFPLLIARDLIWILLLPYRKRAFLSLFYGLTGYLSGYLKFLVPLKKRTVVSYEIQKKFLAHYLFSDLKKQ